MFKTIGVVWVQYDHERYSDSWETLQTLLKEQCPQTEFVQVRVDNQNTQQRPQQLDDQVFLIGGSNRVHEFSAWDEGIRFLEKTAACDAFLLSNDSFLAYGNDYAACFNDEILEWVLTQNSVAGLVDFPPSTCSEIQIQQWHLQYWIRTSFVLMPHWVYQKLQSVISYEDVNDFFDVSFEGRPFSEKTPLNDEYQSYLIQWVSQDWHSAFDLNETTWPQFQTKVRSILNEHTLTARLQSWEIPIWDLRFLQSLQSKYKSLAHLKPPQWQPYVSNIQAQHQILKPSLLKRLQKKLGVLK